MPTYRLTGRLEQGELAELYKAEREDGTQVILKLFHPRTSDAAYAQVLAQAGQVMNPLAHAGVVHVLELGMVGGRLALVREYVDGFTLGVALQRLATKEVVLPPAVALHLVIGLLEIAQRAHDAGLVHGAITPGNILLSYDGHPWLCDFGALQALQASAALRALAGRGRGSYRAPEVNKGEPPTVESDVYSLGAIAYELLTLKELNPGKGMSTRREAIAPPSRVDRRINGRVDPIIMRAVEMLPARRYRACAEMTAALRNFLSVAGGMPSREDVARFVGELFPNEVRVETLGPVPFEGPFALEPVTGASLPSLDEVRASGLHPRSAFTQELLAPGPSSRPESAVETRDEAAPAAPPPPAPVPSPMQAAARAATEWEAPAAAAAPSGPRLHRAAHRAAPSGSGPAVPAAARPRSQASEPVQLPAGIDPALLSAPERSSLPPPVMDAPPEDPAQPGTVPVRPAPSSRAPVADRSDTPPDPTPAARAAAARRNLAEELAELAAGPEPERPVPLVPPAPPPNPRRAALGLALGLGCIGLVGLGLLSSRGGDEVPQERDPAEGAAGPAAAALRPIPRPAHASAGTAPVPSPADAFLTVDSNEQAWVSVDGVRRGKTPLKRLPVAAGTRELGIESVATGERKSFSMDFEVGKERKVMELFQPAPRPR
jgi:serine/threonine protein kinase